MEIAPCFINKRFAKLNNCCSVLLCFFFSPLLRAQSPTCGGIIRAVLTKDRSDCLLCKHSGGCGGWPPVEEALEGIPVLGGVWKCVTFKVPSNPEIPRSLAGLGLHAKLGILPWESLNFRNWLVECPSSHPYPRFFFSFLNSDFVVSTADA